MCILKQRKKPKPNLLIMKSQSKRFAVINQDGMAVIILDTKAEAEKEANQMSDYHNEKFTEQGHK